MIWSVSWGVLFCWTIPSSRQDMGTRNVASTTSEIFFVHISKFWILFNNVEGNKKFISTWSQKSPAENRSWWKINRRKEVVPKGTSWNCFLQTRSKCCSCDTYTENSLTCSGAIVTLLCSMSHSTCPKLITCGTMKLGQACSSSIHDKDTILD